LARVGGDLEEQMAEGEIVAREAVLFRSEHEGYAAARFEIDLDQWPEIGKRYDALLRLAIGQSSGSDDQGAGGDGFGEGRMLMGVFEEFRSADGGAGLAPVRLKGSDDGEVREAEVGHGAGRCADVEGVAGGDEDDVDAVALEIGKQEMIVERKGGADG